MMTEKVHAGEAIEAWFGIPGTPYPAEPPDAMIEELRETPPARPEQERRLLTSAWKDDQRGVQPKGHQIVVLHANGDRFVAEVRDHVVVIDQPAEAGGDDLGPTPTELFVTSLASCVALYAERFLRRHRLPVEGLRVDCAFAMCARPARVESVDLHVSVATELTPSQEAALKAVVDHCTVHNSLRQPPSVQMSVASSRQAA